MIKKIFSTLIIGAMTMSLSSCGFGGPGQVSGGNTQAGQTAGAIGSGIGDFLNMIKGALIPSESQVIGTWVYQRPAVAFTSENALASLGSNVISSGVENKLQTYLSKFGINPNSTSLTFNSDKTFTFNLGNRQLSGTYTVVDKTIQMTFNGQQTASRLTPQLNNGTLIIAADATKIKTFLESIGSSVNRTDVNTIVALMKQFSGMQVGIRLEKK